MGYRCPGQSGRNLKVKLVACPNCGYEVEIFSDELRVTCPACGEPIYQEQIPSCIDWCPGARECVGPERWAELQREREELERLQAVTGPTEVLKNEHRLIERLLDLLEGAAERLKGGEEISPRALEGALGFIRTFADRCHHGKEEDSLFPLLEERGVAREGGPLGVLLREHEEGRGLVRGLAAAVGRYRDGDPKVRERIAEDAQGYIRLLRKHIRKEDDVLFPIADHLLSLSEQRRLLRRFAQVEEEIGAGTHERLEELLVELERDLGLESGGEAMSEKITADSLLGEVIKRYPQTKAIFKKYGMPDYAEERLPMEKLSFFAGVHRVDLERLLEELNRAVRE